MHIVIFHTLFLLIVAILSSYAPNDVPFMADEAVEAVLGKVSYTMRGYMEFVEEIKKLANKLNRDEGVCVCVHACVLCVCVVCVCVCVCVVCVRTCVCVCVCA